MPLWDRSLSYLSRDHARYRWSPASDPVGILTFLSLCNKTLTLPNSLVKTTARCRSGNEIRQTPLLECSMEVVAKQFEMDFWGDIKLKTSCSHRNNNCCVVVRVSCSDIVVCPSQAGPGCDIPSVPDGPRLFAQHLSCVGIFPCGVVLYRNIWRPTIWLPQLWSLLRCLQCFQGCWKFRRWSYRCWSCRRWCQCHRDRHLLLYHHQNQASHTTGCYVSLEV